VSQLDRRRYVNENSISRAHGNDGAEETTIITIIESEKVVETCEDFVRFVRSAAVGFENKPRVSDANERAKTFYGRQYSPAVNVHRSDLDRRVRTTAGAYNSRVFGPFFSHFGNPGDQSGRFRRS